MASRETYAHERGRAALVSWAGEAVDSIDFETCLWALVAVALIGDVHTTGMGLQQGLTEGNPAMRWLIGVGGIGALALAKAGVVGMAFAVRRQLPQFRYAIPLGLALPWLVVVAANLVTLGAAPEYVLI